MRRAMIRLWLVLQASDQVQHVSEFGPLSVDKSASSSLGAFSAGRVTLTSLGLALCSSALSETARCSQAEWMRFRCNDGCASGESATLSAVSIRESGSIREKIPIRLFFAAYSCLSSRGKLSKHKIYYTTRIIDHKITYNFVQIYLFFALANANK